MMVLLLHCVPPIGSHPRTRPDGGNTVDPAATRTRQNRTITGDFHDEATYMRLLGEGKAFVEWALACLLALGVQLTHQATCRGGGRRTRHAHEVRVRLGGVSLWRLQGTTCNAVFTVLPPVVLRYRSMRPEVARDALWATHGGLSLARCAVLAPLAPGLRPRLPESGHRAGPVCAAVACLCPGG
jgi:hypothetical protein